MASVRVNGKPRQKVIAYLGSIRTTMPINHRIVFWLKVDDKLPRLGVADDAADMIRDKIAQRVPYAHPKDWWGGKCPYYEAA